MADENEVNQEVVAEAKSLGWADKDQWRGKEADWVDAPTFLEKGRHVLPIMKQNNERLTTQLTSAQQRTAELEGQVRAMSATVEALEESRQADVEEQVKAAREELKKELAQASRDGDHAAVAEITEKLTTMAAPVKEEKKEVKPQPQQIPPEIRKWYQNNPEYLQPRRIALMNAVSVELRTAGETAIGPAFLDLVAAEVDKDLGRPAARRPASKVEGDRGGRGGGGTGEGGGGKTYADLPADAKAICDRQAARLVGPNRAHKDVNSWRASYAKQFFGEG